jgi:hypothetical protein
MSANDQILPSVARMQPGDHYCGIYRTDEDQRAFVIDYIREGVRKHEKMLYIVNVQTAEHLKRTLAQAGIDVEGLVQAGQLVILTAKEAYLKEGEFAPDKMIALLGEETDKALAEGYSALRATGEMTWALAGDPGSERLVEYESRLNNFFPRSKCYAVCQYDRRKFDPDMLLDILHTHPKVLFGREGYDNGDMYFVPDEAFSSGDRQGAVLNTWLKNLQRRGPTAS